MLPRQLPPAAPFGLLSGLFWVVSLGVSFSAVGACRSEPVDLGPALPERTIRGSFAQGAQSELDLLFVVDDSDGMADKQRALVRAFPALEAALKAGPRGLPDLRVGVVSSDLGAPASRLVGCERGGRGVLRTAAPGSCGGAAPAGRFAVVTEGGARSNFTGSLADAFACIAPLGAEGCGFEQHLAAARRALDADQPLENEGFLRETALLGLVIVADEDDCSVPAGADLFEPGTERYGPQGSFRCNEFGHLCGGRPPPRSSTGPLDGCAPADETGKLAPVNEFVRFFRGIKPRADGLLVQVLAGPATPYLVRAVGAGAEVAPSCTSATGPAAPAVRLAAFASATGGSFASVCEGDLAPTLTRFGETIARRLGVACLDGPPLQRSPGQPDCAVSERVGPLGRERPLPACGAAGLRPCWRVERSPDRCPEAAWELRIERESAPAPGTTAQLTCRACVDRRDPRCL